MSAIASEAFVGPALVERRQRLLHAQSIGANPEIHRLLAQVDAALARLDRGEYGYCETCRDPIESERLLRDPLTEYCSDHLLPTEHERIRQDLALARQIQLGLLPRPNLTIDGWRYGYRYEAAGEVGGDFCDVILRPSGETLVLVGDVSGKGVAASMLMSHLIGTFRSLAPLELPTSQLLSRVNNLFHDSASTSTYATLAAASLWPDGSVDLYSAGHWTPLLRRDGAIQRTEVPAGLPLGLFADSTYRPARFQLAPDDTLLFFTDGVVDAENEREDYFSVARLSQTLASASGTDVQAVVDHCLHDLRRFQSGQGPGDDLLLLAVGFTSRMNPPSVSRTSAPRTPLP